MASICGASSPSARHPRVIGSSVLLACLALIAVQAQSPISDTESECYDASDSLSISGALDCLLREAASAHQRSLLLAGYPNSSDSAHVRRLHQYRAQGGAMRLRPQGPGAGGLPGGQLTPQQRQQLKLRCQVARGDWCGKYDRQAPISAKPPPRGDKDCPKACNGQGNCDHDTGLCHCPAGWTGPDCAIPFKRPCTNRFRQYGNEPTSHIDAEGRDRNWLVPGWTASR